MTSVVSRATLAACNRPPTPHSPSSPACAASLSAGRSLRPQAGSRTPISPSDSAGSPSSRETWWALAERAATRARRLARAAGAIDCSRPRLRTCSTRRMTCTAPCSDTRMWADDSVGPRNSGVRGAACELEGPRLRLRTRTDHALRPERLGQVDAPQAHGRLLGLRSARVVHVHVGVPERRVRL